MTVRELLETICENERIQVTPELNDEWIYGQNYVHETDVRSLPWMLVDHIGNMTVTDIRIMSTCNDDPYISVTYSYTPNQREGV